MQITAHIIVVHTLVAGVDAELLLLLLSSKRTLTSVLFLVVTLFHAVVALFPRIGWRSRFRWTVLLRLLLTARGRRAAVLLLLFVGRVGGGRRLLSRDARRRWPVRVLGGRRRPVSVLRCRLRSVVVRAWLSVAAAEHRVLGQAGERGHLPVGIETAERERTHRLRVALHSHEDHCKRGKTYKIKTVSHTIFPLRCDGRKADCPFFSKYNYKTECPLIIVNMCTYN